MEKINREGHPNDDNNLGGGFGDVLHSICCFMSVRGGAPIEMRVMLLCWRKEPEMVLSVGRIVSMGVDEMFTISNWC